jgi:hypothetical protein
LPSIREALGSISNMAQNNSQLSLALCTIHTRIKNKAALCSTALSLSVIMNSFLRFQIALEVHIGAGDVVP